MSREPISMAGANTHQQSNSSKSTQSSTRVPRMDQRRRPVIRYSEPHLHQIVNAACLNLVDFGYPIYARGASLVRAAKVFQSGGSDSFLVSPGSYSLIPVTKIGLIEQLGQAICWQKFHQSSGEWRPVGCPSLVAEAILARQGDWPFPQLLAVTTAPTLRGDGTILNEQGYDPSTGILFLSELSWPTIPETPSLDDANRALETMKQLIKTFPFVSRTDKSASLALILTALVRPGLPTAPLFGVTAPTPGTGKSKLIDIAAVLATGKTAAVMAVPREEAELKKQLDACLMAGDPFLALDNADHPIRSEFLCQVLTQEKVRARILGESRNLDLPTKVILTATGNSLRFAGDLTRRVVLIKLDAGMERPENRSFVEDVLEVAKRDRVKLVVAGLTMLRAFAVSGEKASASSFGSFETWSDRVRLALIWLGEPDPLSNNENVREDDPERERLHSIIQSLPPGEWQVGSIAKLLREDAVRSDHQKRHAPLTEALYGFTDHKGLDLIGFGKYLRKHRDRIIDGKRIVGLGKRKGSALWCIKDTRSAQSLETEGERK